MRKNKTSKHLSLSSGCEGNQLLPKRRDSLINELGYPSVFCLPDCKEVEGKYIDTMYLPSDITSDWIAYRKHLKTVRPDFCPKITLVGHDESEIENITLMALGGVVLHMNGVANYSLLGKQNIHLLHSILEQNDSHWIGFNIYTGFEGYVFDWIKEYKINSAEVILHRRPRDFSEADSLIKKLLREHKGPIYENGKLVYAPIIVGGHFNNSAYDKSWSSGADYVVRGKGINLLRDILLNLYEPGIYHDPMPYANIPLMDRDGFYRDTYAFSEATKKYATSRIKSVLTALGCAYSCTYCYIGSLIDNLNKAYEGSGLRPPSIIQDRDLNTVIKEGEEIKRLDKKYGVTTTAVFDQADISLNNISWWDKLTKVWVKEIQIPFYIQARPAMLAGRAGINRINIISRYNLVSGISMAIESGDEIVRRLLLDRHENNKVILDAIRNVKSFNIPLRTQAIVGLPVIKPKVPVNPLRTSLSLVDKDGEEYYYDDPLKESIKCLDLVCRSESKVEDYYWNAIYSPFPGTPLGDYTIESGFATCDTVNESYLFTSDSKLNCFDELTAKRQVAFSFTSNFFSHLCNGAQLMSSFIYNNDHFDLNIFASFVENKVDFINQSNVNNDKSQQQILISFLDHAYNDGLDKDFAQINHQLLYYYMSFADFVILAAKVASNYFEKKKKSECFELFDLYRVERNHHYDSSYRMAYIPKQYFEFFNKHYNATYLSNYEFR